MWQAATTNPVRRRGRLCESVGDQVLVDRVRPDAKVRCQQLRVDADDARRGAGVAHPKNTEARDGRGVRGGLLEAVEQLDQETRPRGGLQRQEGSGLGQGEHLQNMIVHLMRNV
jgi:hypothetical protein